MIPDRYSAIRCKVGELTEKIGHAEALGLFWFARSDYVGNDNVWLYIFFDEVGLQKYLSKEWGNRLDDVSEWVSEYVDGQMAEITLAERLVELFK